MKLKHPALFATIFILLSSFLTLPGESIAQCTPNPALFAPGYYPEPLPHGCKDFSYGTQLDIVFQTDTVIFGQTINFDSMVFVSVTNLLAGLNFDLNSPNGHYTANPPALTRACANVSGIPTVANVGADSLELTWQYFVTVFGSPSAVTVTHKIQLTILEGPVVGFTESSSGLDVTFLCTSPGLNNYAWDFGDGGTSTDQNPQYTYSTPGVYNVCLTADDGICQTTFCQAVTVGLTGAENGFSMDVQVWPNPASDALKITLPGSTHGTRFCVQDICGKVLLSQAITAGVSQADLSLDAFEDGSYFLVFDREGVQKTVRFQIMR
jgi:hypothetical protein